MGKGDRGGQDRKSEIKRLYGERIDESRSAFSCSCCRNVGRGLGSGRELSRSSGEDRGALRARRPDRCHGAPDRAEAFGIAEAAVLCREPSRRGRQYRHGAGRKIGARRLHHSGRELELRGQSEPLRKKPVRSVQGLRAGHARRGLAEHPGGERRLPGQDGQRSLSISSRKILASTTTQCPAPARRRISPASCSS